MHPSFKDQSNAELPWTRPQLLGDALGGKVAANPNGKFEIGSAELQLEPALLQREDFKYATVCL